MSKDFNEIANYLLNQVLSFTIILKIIQTYFIHPQLKKFKSGIILSLHKKIVKLTGTKINYVKKYIEYYDDEDVSSINKKNPKVKDVCQFYKKIDIYIV